MDPAVAHLLSLQAVRERANRVYELAEQGRLVHFGLDKQRLGLAAQFVANTISRDFGPNRYHEIPPHGRWQHFNVGQVDRITRLFEEARIDDNVERARVLVDLFLVSVLLDAGSGGRWQFLEPGTSQKYDRSEGIALASLYMFKSGVFSSSKTMTVDGLGLQNLTSNDFITHFQCTDENPITGVASRVELLNEVGKSLLSLSDIFGTKGRPGHLVDYLLAAEGQNSTTLDYAQLWSILQRLLIPTWPKSRTQIDEQPLGDAWPLQALKIQGNHTSQSPVAETIQPFHKLTQWLAYSLSVPFTRLLCKHWENIELGTGLPEYRNGGLFVDLQVLKLKEESLRAGQAASGQELPMFDATSDVIVEWRAMTVALLDRLHKLISTDFEKQGVTLSMAQMLEAGTWKCGRELAKSKRPDTSSSPILIDGDGTLF